eukprot:c18066_g1_i2 orf=221-607(-)
MDGSQASAKRIYRQHRRSNRGIHLFSQRNNSHRPVSNIILQCCSVIQILTNGKYKSVEHRVITNSEKPRMSIASFLNPAMDTKISPLNQLVDDSNPALYRETLFGDYFTNSWAKHLDSKDNLKFSKAP